MKTALKKIIVAVMACLPFLPDMAEAACNPPCNPPPPTLSISGPSYVKKDATVEYTLTVSPALSGLYSWTVSGGLQVVSGEQSQTVTVKATGDPTTSAYVTCYFVPQSCDWSSSTETNSQIIIYNVTSEPHFSFDYVENKLNLAMVIEPPYAALYVDFTVDLDVGGTQYVALARNYLTGAFYTYTQFFPVGGDVYGEVSFKLGEDTLWDHGISVSPDMAPYLLNWTDNILSPGRKISLSGMPMPDVAQHKEGESDYKAEDTYVDALSLDLQHSVTDVHVPVGSDHFALEVRRTLKQEVWNEYGLQMWDTQTSGAINDPALTMGPCWSTTASPIAHIRSYNNGSKKTLTFVDHNGQSYSFQYTKYAKRVNGEWIQGYYKEPSTTQSALALEGVELEEINGTYTLTLPNGTRLEYVSTGVTAQSGSGGHECDHSYYRLESVKDRCDMMLFYGYPSTANGNALVPSYIEARAADGTPISHITITATDDKITAITDPNSNQIISYNYAEPAYFDGTDFDDNTVLSSVSRVDGGTNEYTYDYSLEENNNDSYPAISSEAAPDYNHLTIKTIKDANDNEYTFNYQSPTRFIYASFDDMLPQYGLPRILNTITRPDSSTVGFSENPEGIYINRENKKYKLVGSADNDRENTITDVNGKTWKYSFTDALSCDPTVLEGNTRLFQYQQMTITAPAVGGVSGTEIYRYKRLDESGDDVEGLRVMVADYSQNFSGTRTTYVYDHSGSDYSVIDYSTLAKPSAEIRADGEEAENTTSYVYTDDAFKQIENVTDPLGRKTAYTFDEKGRRTHTKVFSSSNKIVSDVEYVYGNAKFPYFVTSEKVHAREGTDWVDSTDPDPNTEWTVYDIVTDYTKLLDASYGHKTTTTTHPAGGVDLATEYKYDFNNNLISILDPRGNETVNTYDKLNRLITISFYEGTAASGTLQCTKEFWYDLRSNKRWEKDENDHYTYYEYDEFNNLVKTIRVMRANGTEPGEFNPAIIEGHTLFNYLYGYDGDSSVDIISSYSYNDDGTLDYSIDPEGMKTAYAYDDLRRLTDTYADTDDFYSRPSFGHAAYKYRTHYDYSGDNCGAITLPPYKFSPTITIDPRGLSSAATTFDSTTLYETETFYDALSRPWKTTSEVIKNSTNNSTKAITETEYDAVGNVRFVHNLVAAPVNGTEVWQTTETQYDDLNRPVKVIYAKDTDDQAQVETRYTSTGLEWKTINELGKATTVQYDNAGRAIKTTSPSVDDASGNSTYAVTYAEYDDNGNVEKVLDPETYAAANGVVTAILNTAKTVYTYDYRNRLIKTTYPSMTYYSISTS
ncbi:MAG: hypothetical protein JXR23_01200, partial [Pontiellaceae bacterium]|nr:hypothetical protein [Pontiellaceae bacterium]